MKELEGLNLTELMDRMAGLVVPEPASYAPQTVGWTILVGFALGVAAILVLHAARIYRGNAYRRCALRELGRAESRWRRGEPGVAGEIAAIVRRSAVSAYPRREVAGVIGVAWQEFLCATTASADIGDGRFGAGCALLAGAAYRLDPADEQVRLMLDAARHWVGSHRA